MKTAQDIWQMLRNEDWNPWKEPDKHQVGPFTVAIGYDFHPMDLNEDWHPPFLYSTRSNRAPSKAGNVDDLQNPLGYAPSPAWLIEKSKEIEFHFSQLEIGDLDFRAWFDKKREDYLNLGRGKRILQDLADAWEQEFDQAFCDYYHCNSFKLLAALEWLWDLVGVPCHHFVSTGYCQGDYAEVLLVWSPEWVKLVGAPIRKKSYNLEKEIKTMQYWINCHFWGDVYQMAITDHKGEDVDSCCGLYGQLYPVEDEFCQAFEVVSESLHIQAAKYLEQANQDLRSFRQTFTALQKERKTLTEMLGSQYPNACEAVIGRMKELYQDYRATKRHKESLIATFA